ncbi:hypothetical protein KM043_004401 [Ampulex compressa]|nr:hypothetical protein KM043_004401 [Ampulex compressa]
MVFNQSPRHGVPNFRQLLARHAIDKPQAARTGAAPMSIDARGGPRRREHPGSSRYTPVSDSSRLNFWPRSIIHMERSRQERGLIRTIGWMDAEARCACAGDTRQDRPLAIRLEESPPGAMLGK